MENEVFMEGGIKYFTALALTNAIDESVQIMWGILPKSCISIGLYVSWAPDGDDLRAPLMSSIRLLLSDNRDTKKYPPVPDDKWPKKFGVDPDRIMRAKRQIVKAWDTFAQKAKGLNLETLRCMIVVEYVGRYYYRLYSVKDPKAPDPSMLTSDRRAASSLVGGESMVLAENFGQEFNIDSMNLTI